MNHEYLERHSTVVCVHLIKVFSIKLNEKIKIPYIYHIYLQRH